MIDNTADELIGQLESEITQYLTEVVDIGDGHTFSQNKLVRRISLFENRVYPSGKFDSQGNYKHWFDIISSAIDSEVKNIDFDTKDIQVYSNRKSDELPCLITNLKVDEYLRTTGQAEEINSAIEEGGGWGNVLWKKLPGGYERVDLRNVYIINQTARTVDETPIIERHQLTASDLRAKEGKWENVKEVIEQCKSDTYKQEIGSVAQQTTVPYYDVYERNGEICVADLKRAKGMKPSKADEDKYTFAKVIAAGTKGQTTGVNIEYLLFVEEMPGKCNSKLYKEYHRGRYKGRWWREGLYEMLFDLQVRANQIGNQLSQGLELASKSIYTSEDKLIAQSILTDLRNGDILKTKGLTHVDVRMSAFDQLANEWNRIIELRNEISNNREVVQGEGLSGQPFRLGAMLNQNANKLYDFLREKLAIPFSEMFEQWIIPDLIKDIKGQDVLRLTGDPDMLARMQTAIVDDWYVSNLAVLPPHTNEIAQFLKEQRMKELTSRPQLLIKGFKEMFESFKPSVSVNITGENTTMDADLQTLGQFTSLEPDPVRRSALVELMMKKKGIDVATLPKTPPMPAPSPMQPQPSQAAA